MIRTEEFPRDQWESYLNDLSREAKDHLARVRIESPKLGDQILAEGLPLVAITLETKGSEKGAIEIIGERDDGTHITHLIPDPQRIYLARYEQERALCLDIEDGSDTKTLVYVYRGRN